MKKFFFFSFFLCLFVVNCAAEPSVSVSTGADVTTSVSGGDSGHRIVCDVYDGGERQIERDSLLFFFWLFCISLWEL